MGAVADAATRLETAVKTVAGLRVYRDPGASVDPPGAIIGPPSMTAETFTPDPVRATFIVYLTVKADDRALERLWDLVVATWAAIAGDDRFDVKRADPGTWPVGGTDLPAYLITVDTTLI